jgi:signal transduction histidine kinase/ActR/RegA family two-component response regulator
MRTVPSLVESYLLSTMLEDRFPAYLCVDRDCRVLRAGGELKRYGLTALQPGLDAREAAYILVGILPLEAGPLVMPRLEVAPSVFADVHLFTAEEEGWIVLLDASAEVAERARIEQALRQAEEHLRQAERMESVGRLAGGIAHDFNNLLTAILGYGELILGRIDEHDPLHGSVLEIRKAADRGALLIRQLLAFSRRQAARTSAVDLNEIITDQIDMLKRVVGEDVRFELNLEQGLAPVEADRSQMQQVIVNLAVNARDAMPRGGVLTIETRTAKDPGLLSRGECVVLRVADTGTGMDDETRARIFEPFFTTKEVGKGTGLGLSIVYGIVTQSGGEISVRSRPAEGTQFEIRFPRAAAEVPSAPEVKPEGIAPAHGETILLVEDDELVYRLVRQLLAGMDYHVLEAGSARQALEVSEQHSGPIDLLLTDVVMPQMSGTELAERLRMSRPKLKTLFMSGYSSDAVLPRAHMETNASFIGKPFTHEQLSKAIREALDAGAKQLGSAFSLF